MRFSLFLGGKASRLKGEDSRVGRQVEDNAGVFSTQDLDGLEKDLQEAQGTAVGQDGGKKKRIGPQVLQKSISNDQEGEKRRAQTLSKPVARLRELSKKPGGVSGSSRHIFTVSTDILMTSYLGRGRSFLKLIVNDSGWRLTRHPGPLFIPSPATLKQPVEYLGHDKMHQVMQQQYRRRSADRVRRVARLECSHSKKKSRLDHSGLGEEQRRVPGEGS